MGFLDLFKPGGDTVKGAIEGVGTLAKDMRTVITGEIPAEKRAELESKALEIESAVTKAQIELNRQEAEHSSIFVAGWRPFLGWVCGLAIAYAYILQPILSGFLKIEIPLVDARELYPVIYGMLGLAVTRTIEKGQGTQAKH